MLVLRKHFELYGERRNLCNKSEKKMHKGAFNNNKKNLVKLSVSKFTISN